MLWQNTVYKKALASWRYGNLLVMLHLLPPTHPHTRLYTLRCVDTDIGSNLH